MTTRAFTYDGAGSVTYDNRSGTGYGYSYNAARRMSAFSIDGVVQAECVYNAPGQQVIRRLPQTGQTIHVVHDLDGRRIAEYLFDAVKVSRTLTRACLWMDDRAVGVIGLAVPDSEWVHSAGWEGGDILRRRGLACVGSPRHLSPRGGGGRCRPVGRAPRRGV